MLFYAPNTPAPQKKTPKPRRGAEEYTQQLCVAVAFPQHTARISSGMSSRAGVTSKSS